MKAANQLVICQYYIGKWTNWRNYYFGLLTRIQTGWCFWLVCWNNDSILWKLWFCFHLMRMFLDILLFFTCRAGKYCSMLYWILFKPVNSQAWSVGNIQQLYLPFILFSDCKKVWFWSCERCFLFTWGYLQNQL